ncbi:Protein CBG05357 [Caenorhabditis briggsae]|uniref:Protein CBG05357 n=1 Tax=Caenorhabditis briggsae TaxID=6238 RepID=A8WZN9_CAEBR|nr:Protein CBG05357 [Caenorhabditis briggsae]CAP25849.1 Protein CBG05357 [Caenorhabditis briggsae]
MEIQEIKNRMKAYRFVAYSAVAFSVVAVISVCVTLPMVHNYVHHVKRTMQNEIVYCRTPTIGGPSSSKSRGLDHVLQIVFFVIQLVISILLGCSGGLCA